MEDKNEQRLSDFFAAHKTEVPDNGFSRGVMRRLPHREPRTGWIVPLAALLGTVVALLLIDVRAIVFGLYHFFVNVPIVYMLGAAVLVPLVFLVFYLSEERDVVFG